MWPDTHEVAIMMHLREYKRTGNLQSAILYVRFTYENECIIDLAATEAKFESFIELSDTNFVL